MTQQTSTQEVPAQAQLLQMATGSIIARCLYVAAELKIPDLLANAPKTSEELAGETETHAPYLQRVLRTLAGVGVVASNSDGRFELAQLGDAIRSDNPASVRPLVRLVGSHWMWSAFGQLENAVKSGDYAFDRIFGTDLHSYLAEHPGDSAVYNEAMVAQTGSALDAILQAYDFSGARRIVDVGGGHGLLLSTVLKTAPAAEGVLMDLSHVVDSAKGFLEQEGLSGRTTVTTGDYLRESPAGGDLYLLKHIVHWHDDETASAILANSRREMAQDGKVLVLETVVPEGDEPGLATVLDIVTMLNSHDGRERTAQEFEALAAPAGLKLERVIPTESYLSIMEYVAA